jgi:hypothetical protein
MFLDQLALELNVEETVEKWNPKFS